MSERRPSAFLEGLVAAALDAGVAILTVYATDFEVARKDDASPVTEADEKAEAVIFTHLARLAPEIPIVAEEAAAAGRIPPTEDRFFLVDPLDGTKEFIRRNGEFTVNIALIDAGLPVAGVVYAPVLGRIFAAEAGRAFAADVTGGRVASWQPIRVRTLPTEGVTVIGSRSHGGGEAEALAPGFTIAEAKTAGSSLKFCLVAAGEADFYARLGRTMEWDTAAGDAVLRAAGGVMLEASGRPFVYGKRAQADDVDFANPHFVAASCRQLIAAARPA